MDTYFSSAARAMRQSAIRKAGDLESVVDDLISLAPGFPDPRLFAWDELREIAQTVLTGADASVLQYGQTRGYRPLLEALTDILSTRGIRATPQETIVTTGSQQALDLCARVFVDPGDVVLVERPGYTGAITAFGNAQATVAGVRQDADGIDLDDLDSVLLRERGEGRRIALLYIVPNFQNPTGILMSRERRARLLEWAGRRSVLIVEDDPYGVLHFDDVATADETRPIKADDAEGRVVYLSTFSKTVAPGLRVAWVTGPAAIVDKLEVAKQSIDLCTGSLDQRLVYEFWRRGALDAHVPLLREGYRQKRIVMERALARELDGLVSWSTPRGGFFLWASFRRGIDTDALLARAVAHGVHYVPGSAFYVGTHAGSEARLSFAAPSRERIDSGIRRLASAVHEELESSAAVPERASPAEPPAPEGASLAELPAPRAPASRSRV
jgi:2-aminoadipate transaminase